MSRYTSKSVISFNNATTESRTIQFAGTTVSYSKVIRVLGVIIDHHLTFDKHITNVVQSCNHHSCSLRHYSSVDRRRYGQHIGVLDRRMSNGLLQRTVVRNDAKTSNSATDAERARQSCVQCTIPLLISATTEIVTLAAG